MATNQTMALGNRMLGTLIRRWPAALIVVGGALTLVWSAALVWLPLHLLKIL